tara:strand:+ start:173 stop:415 length:243 start_codon:yes stop_codon:yes gene_type:complete
MKIELNDDQLKIIRRALSDAIEKHIGVSEAQGAFLNNIDNGMNMKKAKEQFEIDNRKEWEYLMYVEKNPLYLLYDYLFNR